MIPTYCIAHKEPRLAAHLYDAIIHTPPRPDYEALVSVVAHPVIAALAPSTGLVKVCGWRKIVTQGNKSHETIPEIECSIIPRSKTEPSPGFEFLICAHDFFKIGRRQRSIREQWDAAHYAEDLTDCLELAERMGVMSRGECRALEEEPVLIEGGFSMGAFPATLLRATINRVWPLYRAFAKRYAERFLNYDPMQRRCVPFLAERIETHFILKELRRRYPGGIPREVFGCLTAVWNGPWESGTIGADRVADIVTQVGALRTNLLSIHGAVASPNLTEAIDLVNALDATVKAADPTPAPRGTDCVGVFR